jgi:flagellar basal-body rod protein FlgC
MSNVTEILASGLSLARLRVNILSSNLANAQTTRTAEGGPFKRRDVVQTAQAIPTNSFNDLDREALRRPVALAVVADQSEPRRAFEPGHPDADQQGYVSYPNINVVQTMTDLMSASRLYQANLTAMDASSEMRREALRIGQVA